MVLNNVIMADSGRNVSIRISGEKITGMATSAIDNKDGLNITFNDAIVFPGLINSHDHLDFNLFPQLGDKIYNNYSEWGAYIHQQYKTEIAGVLKVPQTLRSEWGMYKNLLCGVTTVVNHGSGGDIPHKLINIFEEKHDLHSVGFDKQWKLRLNNPLKKKLPVVIHAGEGTDEAAKKEIDRLINNNHLRRELIAIHGVAMQPEQAPNFKALVWCPDSNFFLLGKTAPVDKLKQHTKFLFGTDSTLTGNWDIWEHIRLAKETGLLSDEELYQALNGNAADVWGVNTGSISAGKNADIVVAKMNAKIPAIEAFFSLTPADLLLVMHKGKVRLIDETIADQLKAVDLNSYTEIYLKGCRKYVEGDITGLTEKIKSYYPAAELPVSFNR